VQFYTASFGQGITTTPLQLAAAYGALANGGTLLRPLIVEQYLHEDGTIDIVDPEEVRQVVSRETSETIGTMLENVVVNGHGKRAGVPGYRVAGKTGTAQVAKTSGGGYEEDRTIGTFAGFAPLPDPKYALVVVVENPKDVQWAESSAAPVFREILEMIFHYEKIEPTN
jgi:stage V sporulation protein D (sporulation-specific penicillin-binding protein)